MENKNNKIPEFIYGTAWKEEATAQLTKKSVKAGFRAIDTANQKKHYREDFVGQALLELFEEGVKRESLFLQSKFTYSGGQDHRLPYDPNDKISTQVISSFESTLKNLNTDYIDSYLLHGPSASNFVSDSDWEVWETFENLYKAGKAKMLGVSNVTVHQVKELVEKAKIKPVFVQNRCFANQGWDKPVREYCLSNQIIYQGFSLLTANPQVVKSPSVSTIAAKLRVTPQQVVFRFAKQIGILALTGTTSELHMKEDLAILNFELTLDEMSSIATLSKHL